MKRKTNDEFKKEIYDIYKDEFILLEEYKGCKEKITIKHTKCGNIFKTTPDNLLHKGSCPKCRYEYISKKQSITNEEFINIIYKLVENEYTVLGKYKNSQTKILMKHNLCGHEYNVVPNSFTQGSRCPKCFGKNKKSTSEFADEVLNLVGDEYSVLSKYKNSKTKVKIKHNVCGNEYYTTRNNFLKGNRCPNCSKIKRALKRKKNTEQFIKEVNEKVGNEYKVLDKYESGFTKILMKHNKCGFEFKVEPSRFLNGSRCPKCAGTNFENDVFNILKSMNLKINCQQKFEDLRDKNYLSYDFSILDDNNDIIMLIESNGIQHYEYMPKFFHKKGKWQYYKQIKHDNIKAMYAINHNIPLLVIPYWEKDNVEQIIKSNPIIKQLLNKY